MDRSSSHNSKDIARYLRALFAAKEETEHILLWTVAEDEKRSKVSHWFTDLDAAVRAAIDLAAGGKHHVYAGVGLSAKNFGLHRRCPADQISSVVGLWLDVDFAKPGSSSSAVLPKDEREALGLIRQASVFRPTLIVRSGNGIHVYWLFKEPYSTRADEDRAFLAGLIHRWQLYIRKQARLAGWSVDSTHDLARVMRVAGSPNIKTPGQPILSSIAEYFEEFRPEPSDIAAWLDDQPAESFDDEPAKPARVGSTPVKNDVTPAVAGDSNLVADAPFGLVFDAEASPNSERLLELFELFPDAKKSWDGKRKFGSLSERDYSLMYWAKVAGWSDQEITNLVIMFRRTIGGRGSADHQKALRRDYIVRSLTKLAQKAKLELREDESFVEEAADETRDQLSRGDTTEIAEALRNELGIDFARWYRYGDRQSVWEIEMLDGRRRKIGTTRDLMDGVRALNTVLVEELGVAIRGKRFRSADYWLSIVERIAAIAIPQPLALLSTEDQVVDLLRDFITGYLDDSDDALSVLVAQQKTFVRDGSLYLRRERFREEVKRRDRDLAGATLEHALSSLGFEQKPMSFRVGARKSSRSYYVVAVDSLPNALRESLIDTEEAF